MSVENAEIQASRAWRNQETGQYGIDSERIRGDRQTGSKARRESITVHRNDRKRGNFVKSSGQTIAGGIFDRLISKTREQIEESELRTADLKEQLEELEQLFKQFSQNNSED